MSTATPTPDLNPTPNDWAGRWARVWPVLLAVTTVTAVGGPAAVASYRHARDVVASTGDTVMAPWLPLSIDGMLVAALVVLWVRRRRSEPAGALPWLSFGLGMLATIAANLAAVGLTVARAAAASSSGPRLALEGATAVDYIAALWPPLALALTLELVALVAYRTAPVVDTPTVDAAQSSSSSPSSSTPPAVPGGPHVAPSATVTGSPSPTAAEGAAQPCPDEDELELDAPAGDPRFRNADPALVAWALTNRQPNGRPAGKKAIMSEHGCTDHAARMAAGRAGELAGEQPLRLVSGGDQ